MKKILISISVIVCVVITSLVLAFTLINRKTEIKFRYVYSYTKYIDLGSYQVKDFEYNQFIPEATFKVKSANDFYNDFIKTNPGYIEELDLDIDEYFAYGFLKVDNEFIKYIIHKDNSVELIEFIARWGIDKENLNDYYTGIFDSYTCHYNIVGPMNINITYERLNTEDKEWEHYNSIRDKYITYDLLLKIYSYLPSESYKIDGNTIYLKGWKYGSAYIDEYGGVQFNNDDDILYYTDMYLIKIINKDGELVVENADK